MTDWIEATEAVDRAWRERGTRRTEWTVFDEAHLFVSESLAPGWVEVTTFSDPHPVYVEVPPEVARDLARSHPVYVSFEGFERRRDLEEDHHRALFVTRWLATWDPGPFPLRGALAESEPWESLPDAARWSPDLET